MPQAAISGWTPGQVGFTTYDLNVGVIVDIESLISQLAPSDVPLLTGGGDGMSAITRGTCFEKKVEWLDDTLLTPRSTLNGALTTGTTAVVIATADANHFGVGDVLQFASGEKALVTVLSTDGVTLTVTRAFAGTTAVNQADASNVVGVGKALAEGSDPKTARAADRTSRYNYTQIFGPEAVAVSGTEMVVRKYGVTNEFDYQAGQRLKEKWIALEQAIVYGSRYEDTTNKLRTMGGFTQYFGTVDSSTTTLTDAKLLDMLQSLYALGGDPTTVLAGPKQRRTISTFEASQLRRDATSSARGESVSQYISDFGTVDVYIDRWVNPSDVFVFNRNDIELDTLRPMQFEMLAKTGDSVRGQIVGEYTLKVRRAVMQGRFSALT